MLGVFYGPSIWPGASHQLTFANGSSVMINTVASTSDFSYRNSREVYRENCLPSNDSTVSGDSTSSQQEPPINAPSAYPTPFNRERFNQIMGFFSDASHLKDVGVLAVPTFGRPETGEQMAEVSRVATEFVKQASNQGKKKILIDLSGNGGGAINSGLNLFRIFFPETEIYSATRFRSHEAIDLMGRASQNIPANESTQVFEYQGEVKPDGKHGFSSWKDLYGPYNILGVNSSSLCSYNLTTTSTSTNPINGYGASKPGDPAKALFKPQDIVLVCYKNHATLLPLTVNRSRTAGVRPHAQRSVNL